MVWLSPFASRPYSPPTLGHLVFRSPLPDSSWRGDHLDQQVSGYRNLPCRAGRVQLDERDNVGTGFKPLSLERVSGESIDSNPECRSTFTRPSGGPGVKATAQAFVPSAVLGKPSWLSIFSDLVKARLTFLVLLTTLVGFYVGSSGPFDAGLMVATLAGTGLMACGAAALNQLAEREYDAKMRRTQTRPLPAGKLQPDTVLVFGGLCSI